MRCSYCGCHRDHNPDTFAGKEPDERGWFPEPAPELRSGDKMEVGHDVWKVWRAAKLG